MRLNLCVSMLELSSLQNVDDEFFTIPNGEEIWAPFVYIIGFMVNQLKTRLRSSLACAFAQRPSSWASRAHRVPVPVANLLTGQTAAAEAAEASFQEHVGVLVLAPHNSLVYLHFLLDRKIEVDGQFVHLGIIGISNCRVDPANPIV